ncbi:MAG: hypothetical protein CME70_13545 [Halobacteriovorax sp.]|nr:hypothetical protein [Halobacteriovorax sp.]|tara:strand:+ start:11205 stop:12641 length:1437 start_codon:yes stop_codon:yes gene_type:complete
MLKKYFWAFLFTVSFCYADGQTSKEIKVFFKCYGQLVRERLDPAHPLIKRIKSKSLSGANACLKLIESAEFGEDGMLKNRNSPNAKKVLKTIQSFHNNWFPRFDFNIYTQDHPNSNVFDKNEMGYHLTWSLLKENSPFSFVFTNSNSFKAIRESKIENKFSNDKDISGTRYDLSDPQRKWIVGGKQENNFEFGMEYIFKPKLVAFGTLVGLEPLKKDENLFRRIFEGKKTNTIDLNYPKFNGVMGTIPYLLLNAGQNKKKTDGGNILHRRWATSVFEDLLCRTHPLLNKEDSVGAIQVKSKIGFRKTNTCMNCHYPIDSLATLTRNIELFNAGEVNGDYFTFRAIEEHKGILPPSKEALDFDASYYKRRPKGKLVFRSVNGKLIDIDLNDPDELGEALAQLDAPYFCAAKRYFNFLTGIDVGLHDFSKFGVDEAQKKFLPYREFVLKIGKDLKEHQSLKKLFYSIVSSPYFTKEHGNE